MLTVNADLEGTTGSRVQTNVANLVGESIDQFGRHPGGPGPSLSGDAVGNVETDLIVSHFATPPSPDNVSYSGAIYDCPNYHVTT